MRVYVSYTFLMYNMIPGPNDNIIIANIKKQTKNRQRLSPACASGSNRSVIYICVGIIYYFNIVCQQNVDPDSILKSH